MSSDTCHSHTVQSWTSVVTLPPFQDSAGPGDRPALVEMQAVRGKMFQGLLSKETAVCLDPLAVGSFGQLRSADAALKPGRVPAGEDLGVSSCLPEPIEPPCGCSLPLPFLLSCALQQQTHVKSKDQNFPSSHQISPPGRTILPVHPFLGQILHHTMVVLYLILCI